MVLGLAALAGWLLVRGLVSRSVPWIGIAVVLVPLVGLGYTERQWQSAEQVFSKAAVALAPQADGIHCQRLGETFTYAGAELGHVWFDASGDPDGTAFIAYDVCQDLTEYWQSSVQHKATPTIDELVAVHVLSHEAMHLKGVLPEALAECEAMQHNAWLAEALGARPEDAQALAERYWLAIYPRMPAEYRTDRCYEDGPLDRTPGDGIWP